MSTPNSCHQSQLRFHTRDRKKLVAVSHPIWAGPSSFASVSVLLQWGSMFSADRQPLPRYPALPADNLSFSALLSLRRARYMRLLSGPMLGCAA